MEKESAPLPPLSQTHELDLSDFTKAVRRSWRLVICLGILGAGAVTARTYFKQPMWRAQTRLLMAKSNDAPAGLAATLTGGGSKVLDMIQGVMTSNSSMSKLAEKTGIPKKDLSKILKSKAETDISQFSITYESENRDEALKVVKTALGILTQIDQEIGLSVSTRKGNVLREKYDETLALLKQKEKEALAAAKSSGYMAAANPEAKGDIATQLVSSNIELRAVNAELQEYYQQSSLAAKNAPDLPTGSDAEASLREALVTARQEVFNAEKTEGPDSPKLKRLKNNLDSIYEALRKEATSRNNAITTGVDLRTSQFLAKKKALEIKVLDLQKIMDTMPEESAAFERSKREIDALAAAAATLRTQYQQQLVLAKTDSIKWSVLDPPYIEDEPTNKKYTSMAAFGFIAGVLIAILIVGWRMSKKPTT